MKFRILYLSLALLILGCIEKMTLPTAINTNTEFAAGDTTYLIVNPVWDETYGFVAPIEISIAPDGRIFIADSGANCIFVLDQSGNMLSGYDDLKDLDISDDNVVSPIDVDVDQKMNIYFIDGSDRIYRWNHYWNNVGVNFFAAAAIFSNIETGDTISLGHKNPLWFELLNHPEWIMTSIEWSNEQSVIDSILGPHVFFEGSWARNTFADLYYESENNNFSGIAATLDSDNYIYAQDYHHNRIIKIFLERSQYIQLSNGELVWVHSGTFGQTVIAEGTGAGTVNLPLGIDVDYAGNLYYSQGGEFFAVHKVRPVVTGPYTVYQSVFQVGINEIMDLFRFGSPADVAVDLNQNIYVANTEGQEIQVFNSNGQLFKKAGVEEVTVDTTMWVTHENVDIEVDTFIVKEMKGFLTSPQAITVDKRGVIYICDTPTSRILRYRLSNKLDEDLQPLQ